MALERKILRDRFDIVVAEIARLAGLGYALVPLTVKMSGIVMYATMEINTDQLAETEKTEVRSRVESTDVKPDTAKVETASPVTAKVSTKQSTKAVKKDAG